MRSPSFDSKDNDATVEVVRSATGIQETDPVVPPTSNERRVDPPASRFMSRKFKVLVLLAALLLILCARIAMMVTIGLPSLINKPSPKENVRSLAAFHKMKKEPLEIKDLPIEKLHSFDHSDCVSGDSADDVREKLRQQLHELPATVREAVINRAVTEATTRTDSNAWEDAFSDIDSGGRAHIYKSFFSTSYNRFVTQKYETCFILMGVEVTIANWVYDTKKVQIGVTPCECGYFRCMSCPVFDTVVSNVPTFKRQSLTLKQHYDLHAWMKNLVSNKAEELASSPVHSSLPTISTFAPQLPMNSKEDAQS